MKRKSVSIGSATLILACGIVPQVFAQSDELEVTMQVLDDVSDIDGVILSIDPEPPLSEDQDRQAVQRRPVDQAADESAPAERERDPARDDLDLDSELDREEESEGELEDFDFPEDVELPEPDEEE